VNVVARLQHLERGKQLPLGSRRHGAISGAKLQSDGTGHPTGRQIGQGPSWRHPLAYPAGSGRQALYNAGRGGYLRGFMDHLNRRLALAAIVAAIIIVGFVVMLTILPPDEGGVGSMIQGPSNAD
jgi:hypothetical protein